MVLTARQLLNNDTTDIGYDLVLDPLTTPAGDVGVTKIMIGAAGANDGLISAALPLPVNLGTDNDVTITSGTVTTVTTVTAVTTITNDVNVSLQDGAGTDLTSTLVGADQSLDVNLTQSVALDVSAATITVAAHAVTNAGTFAVQIVDTSFAVADGNALGEGVLVQGDDGTDRKNINVDATTGDVQVDVTNTVTVTATALDVRALTNADVVTAELSATDNAVLDTIDAVLDTINAKLVTGTVIGDVNLGATDNAVLDTIDAVLDTINAKLVTGTVIGDVNAIQSGAWGVAATQSGTWNVDVASTGGATPGMKISTADTNSTNVKASAGTLYTLAVFNTNAAARYFKLYDKATAPTVGTDTPIQVFAIPGNTAGSGFILPIPPQGIAFASGIGFGMTTGVAIADTGAVAADDIVASYSFK